MDMRQSEEMPGEGSQPEKEADPDADPPHPGRSDGRGNGPSSHKPPVTLFRALGSSLEPAGSVDGSSQLPGNTSVPGKEPLAAQGNSRPPLPNGYLMGGASDGQDTNETSIHGRNQLMDMTGGRENLTGATLASDSPGMWLTSESNGGAGEDQDPRGTPSQTPRSQQDAGQSAFGNASAALPDGTAPGRYGACGSVDVLAKALLFFPQVPISGMLVYV